MEFSIQKLKATLDSATIADPPLDQEKAGFGAFVHVRASNGETETYQIVGVEEAEPAEGRISSLSPLGRVLMNRRAGEKVQFNSPAGDQEIGILRVWY